MSQNNTLSAKAQNIIAKFINKNSHKSSISRTDVMKHAIVTLYAQMPEAKPELIAPFKDCIFDLHTHFTQEEIDVLVAECPQVIMYCLKFASVMGHIEFGRYDEIAEEMVSKDVPLNIYKTPESIIELCARLSGKPTANDKVYMPYSDFADYPLYYPEAEYHIECEDRSCGDDGVLENYTNAYTKILLDSQRVKSKTVYGYSGFTKIDLSMHPNYIFGCNPVLSLLCSKDALKATDGMWTNNHVENITSVELGQNIALWLYFLANNSSIDLVLPQNYFYESGIWPFLRHAFNGKLGEMEINATFITLSGRLFDCECGDVFLLHIEKEKGNNGMIRLIDATGSDFYKNRGTTEEYFNAIKKGDEKRILAFDYTNPNNYHFGGLNVDFLMDIINQKECDSKYEERLHYTQFFAENEYAPNQHIIDKKLPALAEGEKYIALRELVDMVPAPKMEEKDCEMQVLEDSSLRSDYMDCDIDSNTLPQKKLNGTDTYFAENHFLASKDCLVFGLYWNNYTKGTRVGKLHNVDSPIAVNKGIVPFKLKSSVITEEYLLRELTEDYCSMQAIMLSECIGGSYLTEAKDLLNIKIAVPSLEEQERRCKNDAQAYLKEADRKIIQSAKEFQRDVHMKKHAIGQTLFNLGNWWDLLLKARKEGNGIVDDEAAIGKKNKVLVSDIYANIQMSLEKLQMQVDRFWTADGFKVQSLSLESFVKEYAGSHQNPMFSYKCAIEPSLSGKSATEVTFAKEALIMVFDNIINNACCHGFGNADSDKNVVKIEIGTDDYPYVIISNNGQPFHEALTAEDVFTYGRSSNAGQNHYGIGGYEVRNIMRKFGGEAEFISTPEKEFSVSYKLTFKRTDNIQK